MRNRRNKLYSIKLAAVATGMLAALGAAAADVPNAALTPGDVDPAATMSVVCGQSTQNRRHVTEATKHKVFQEYGIPYANHRNYEVDHLISLEAGGSNSIKNLWPERYCRVGNDPRKTGCYGAREKDKVENDIHRKICSGELGLREGQDILAHDWLGYFKKNIENKRRATSHSP